MAGAIRKMATYLGLVEDDDLHSGEYHGDSETARSTRDRVIVTEQQPDHGSYDEQAGTPTRSGKVTAIARPWERSNYRIPVVLPTTYNDARRIGEEFRNGSPVIMDLTSMSDADAKRIVDFAAGLVFGLRGGIERVSAKIFLLSPEGVDVSDLAHEQVGDGFGHR